MMLHSPLPWKIIRHPAPYGDWIMASNSAMVCGLFGKSDEAILLSAPLLLLAITEAMVALDQGQIVRARRVLADVVGRLG